MLRPMRSRDTKRHHSATATFRRIGMSLGDRLRYGLHDQRAKTNQEIVRLLLINYILLRIIDRVLYITRYLI